MKSNWEVKTLAEVADLGSGNSAPQKKELFEDGEYPFFRTSDIGQIHIGEIENSRDYLNEKGVKGLKLFPKNTLLIPKSGASTFLNHRVILGIDGYVSSHLATIKANEDVLDNRFLFHFMTTIDSKNLIQDIAYPSLKVSDIGKINIEFPPLAEQKRIVAILDEAFAAIGRAKANAEKNLQNASELFDSYLQSVFANPGDSWEEKTLGEVCDFSQGIQVDVKLQSENMNENQVRFLRIVDFTQGNELPRYINNPGEKYLLNADDISLVRYGASTGFVCKGLEGALANNLFRVIPKVKNQILNQYLFIFLKSPTFQNVIKATMNGAAMPAISFGLIRDIKMPIMPLIEQQEIVNKLDSISAETKKLENIYRQKINDLDELKKSILQKAFNGEL